jgi:hypothetical protein
MEKPKNLTVDIHDSIGVSDYVDAEVIKIRTVGPGGVEREFEYPTTRTTIDIVTESTRQIETTTTTTLPPEAIEQITETVDYAKSAKPYWSKFKVGFRLLGSGFDVEVERSPSLVTKTIKKA